MKTNTLSGLGTLPGLLTSVLLASASLLNLSCSSTSTTPPAPAELSATIVCNNAGPLLVIVNAGGPMEESATVSITYADGKKDSMEVLVSGESRDSCRLSNVHGASSVTIDGIPGSLHGGDCLSPVLNTAIGDVAPYLPDPIDARTIAICYYTTRVKNTRWGSQAVTLSFTNPTRIHVVADMSNFSTDLEITAPGFGCIDINGTLKFDRIRINCDAFVTENSSGVVSVNITNLTSSFVGGDLSGNFAADILGLFMSALQDRISTYVLAAWETNLERYMPPLLKTGPECQ